MTYPEPFPLRRVIESLRLGWGLGFDAYNEFAAEYILVVTAPLAEPRHTTDLSYGNTLTDV